MNGAVASLVSVADPRRPALGRAIKLTMLAALVFVGSTVIVKDIRSLSLSVPWTEDPYDAFMSFAIFFVPLVVCLSGVRLALCRQTMPLPVPRVIGLIRGANVIVGVILITLAAAWISLALDGSHLRWSPTLAALTGWLALQTMLAAEAAREVHGASNRFGLEAVTTSREPDWLRDAVLVVGLLADRLGRFSPAAHYAVAPLERRAAPWIRRHPITTALVVAILFGGIFGGGALIEGDPGLLVLLIASVGTAGMFAFLVLAGAYLLLVNPGAHSSRPPYLGAGVAAATMVPVTLAFRDSLWWIVGTSTRNADIPHLAALLALVMIITFAVVAAGTRLRRR